MTVTVPVYFQPWKYEHERHLHVPLAVHVAEALNETWKKLPTDIEKRKGALTAAGETLEKATELAEGVSEDLKKAKGLFDGAIGALQSRVGAVVAGTTDVMLTAVGAPPLASVAPRKILGAFGHGDTDGSDAVDPDGGEEPEVTDDTERMPSRTPKSAVKKEKKPPPSPTTLGLGKTMASGSATFTNGFKRSPAPSSTRSC